MVGFSPFVFKSALASLSAGSVAVVPLIYSVHAPKTGGSQVLSPLEQSISLVSHSSNISNWRDLNSPESLSLRGYTPSPKEEKELDVSKFIEKNTGMIQPNWELMTRSENVSEIPLKNELKLQQINESREIHLEKNIEKSEDYKRFIDNLILIVGNAIWTNTPVQGLWVDQVNLTAPKEEWRKVSATLEKEKSEGSLKTSEITNTDGGVGLEVAEVVGMAFPSQSLRRSLREDSWTPSSQIDRNLKMMANLVRSFTSENWSTIGKGETPESLNRSQLRNNDFVLSDIQLRTFSVSTGWQTGYIGEPVRHVIRLVRVHEGKYYYCDIFFNGARQQDMIRVNFVKDSRGGGVARLQANGSNGTYGEHIGGDPKFAHTWERQYNSTDREFANLFVDQEGRAKKIYKWFEVIARCAEQRECRELFYDDSHSSWSWWGNSSRARDYGGFNPFSKIYNTVNSELDKKELSLFEISTF